MRLRSLFAVAVLAGALGAQADQPTPRPGNRSSCLCVPGVPVEGAGAR